MLGWDTLKKSKICCHPLWLQNTKYMACLPLYLKEMRDLPQTHCEVYDEFINGNFTYQHKQGKANGVWSDLVLEQTYNKQGKTTFLKRVTQNNAAREKYIKTAPLLTNVSGCVKDMPSMGPECRVIMASQKAGQRRFRISRNYEREN